jgi:hypothetical protein
MIRYVRLYQANQWDLHQEWDDPDPPRILEFQPQTSSEWRKVKAVVFVTSLFIQSELWIASPMDLENDLPGSLAP